MYSILLLDDRIQDRTRLKEKFESYQFKVFDCRELYDAIDIWKKHKDELDAIVFDIMMSSSGLEKVYRETTDCGLLSGWIWLWNILNPDKEEPHPAAKKCIIIYSAYLEDLDEYFKTDIPNDMEKKFFRKVIRIEKDFSNKNVNEVIKRLINDRDKKGGR